MKKEKRAGEKRIEDVPYLAAVSNSRELFMCEKMHFIQHNFEWKNEWKVRDLEGRGGG